MKATTAYGMTVQVLDYNGRAVNRKWFSCLDNAKVWLDIQYPHLDELGYSIEIFYDEL